MRLLIAAAVAAISTLAAASPADETRIRVMEQEQASAWDAHDIARYAALFAPGANTVNVLGWWWKSRDELQAKLGAAHRSVFRDSHLTITSVDLRFISPAVAVAHVRWTMTGALSPTGAPGLTPVAGIQTQVLEKREGHWLITEFQNTNSVPERPF